MHDPRKKFINLIGEIRQALGYSLREEELLPDEDLAMEMDYGGFSFSIVHSKRNSPKNILIECIYGDIPAEKELEIIINLLEMNCALAEIDGSVFCIDPDSGLLMYTISLYLNENNAETILRKMTEIVWHGRRWRANQFLENKNESKNLILEVNTLA